MANFKTSIQKLMVFQQVVSQLGKEENGLLNWNRWIQKIGSKLLDLWVDFLTSSAARIILAIVLCVYWAISTYGILQVTS